MTDPVKQYVLEIEWCNVQHGLANDPSPATQVLREPCASLQDAFNQIGRVHNDLFDPVKVNATGLPAFIKSVGLFEDDNLIMYRSSAKYYSALKQQTGACLVIPEKLINKGMLKAIGGVLTGLQNKQGCVIPVDQPAARQKQPRKRIEQTSSTVSKQRRP